VSVSVSVAVAATTDVFLLMGRHREVGQTTRTGRRDHALFTLAIQTGLWISRTCGARA